MLYSYMTAQSKSLMQLSRTEHSLDESYLPLLKDIHFTPIFILGNHRSGTTLLYKLLAATQCFNFVTAYHVIKYNEILFNHVNRRQDRAKEELRELFKSLDLNNRSFDDVAVVPDLPEEYGFILINTRYQPKLSPKNLPVFIELCKKIQFVSAPGRPLLIKNPWDYPNFIYVKSAFPEAKFIFIHRNPIHVINSQLRALRPMLAIRGAYTALLSQRYAKLFDNPAKLFVARLLFSSHFNLGVRVFTIRFVWITNYFLKNIGSLPKTDYISVRYEDLCENPETNVVRILEFLGLEQNATLSYEALIKPRPIELLEEVKRRQSSILKRLASYLAYC